MPLNMKKEIRAEIKTLRRAENKLGHDLVAACRAAEKRWQTEEKIYRRTLLKATKITDKMMKRIQRRIAILEGRLA